MMGRPAKNKTAEEVKTIEVPAEEVVGITEDGKEIPVTDILPELVGETVEAPMEEPEEQKEDKQLEMLKAQNELLLKQLAEMQKRMDELSRPQIVQVMGDTGEKVQFLWQAPVADDNVVKFGQGGMFGRIVGKTGTFIIPKSDISRIMDEKVRKFLDKRWLLVVSGLNEDEREALGVNYKVGEILDKKAFEKLVELEEGILEIYPNLCDSHKEIVAKTYAGAFEKGSKHVKRSVVVALNKLSKEAGRKGDFVDIVEAMNAKELE